MQGRLRRQRSPKFLALPTYSGSQLHIFNFYGIKSPTTVELLHWLKIFNKGSNSPLKLLHWLKICNKLAYVIQKLFQGLLYRPHTEHLARRRQTYYMSAFFQRCSTFYLTYKNKCVCISQHLCLHFSTFVLAFLDICACISRHLCLHFSTYVTSYVFTC